MEKIVYIRKSSICQIICIPVKTKVISYGFLGLRKKKIRFQAKIYIYYSECINKPYFFTFDTNEEMEKMKIKIIESLEDKSDLKLFSSISLREE